MRDNKTGITKRLCYMSRHKTIRKGIELCSLVSEPWSFEQGTESKQCDMGLMTKVITDYRTLHTGKLKKPHETHFQDQVPLRWSPSGYPWVPNEYPEDKMALCPCTGEVGRPLKTIPLAVGYHVKFGMQLLTNDVRVHGARRTRGLDRRTCGQTSGWKYNTTLV